MLSRNIPSRVGAAKEAPRCRAYRWSSDRRPRTRPSVGALCCGGLCPPSAIPDADSEHTASVPAQLIREHSGSRTADTQNRPANGRRPDRPGTPLRWRTVTGIRAGSSEMLGAARHYATSCGLLKQPAKQKTSRREGGSDHVAPSLEYPVPSHKRKVLWDNPIREPLPGLRELLAEWLRYDF